MILIICRNNRILNVLLDGMITSLKNLFNSILGFYFIFLCLAHSFIFLQKQNVILGIISHTLLC